LEWKLRFKEAFYEIQFAMFFLILLESQQELDPISLDWFYLPSLSLATSGVS
jgi:hypothetical protein